MVDWLHTYMPLDTLDTTRLFFNYDETFIIQTSLFVAENVHE